MISVALDGPAGAGKSTLAKRVAKHFNFIYVDTGALYRSIGLFTQRNNVASKDLTKVTELLPLIKLEMKYDNDGIQRMFLNGEDVTDDIRLPEVSTYASDVSAMLPVRDFLLSMQQNMAKKYNVIMDGRDIGTVVLPNADLKIFITASPETRAKRRFIELKEKDIDTTFEEVLSEMIKRDKNDSERDIAPLKAAEDAIILDTTNLDFEQSFEALCKLVSDIKW
ncbi:MAG: (d)CMP kinase [Oscillospiraceae bacterium]|jgi:cytidylate kinase|nr:(d)CMP kinase [Oscillospiraceae bacterium]